MAQYGKHLPHSTSETNTFLWLIQPSESRYPNILLIHHFPASHGQGSPTLYPTFPKFLPHVQPIARPLPVCIHCWFSKTISHPHVRRALYCKHASRISCKTGRLHNHRKSTRVLRWTLNQREMQLLFFDKVTLWYWEVKASAYHNQRKNWCILRNQ